MKISDLLKFHNRNRQSGSRRRNVTPAVPGTVESLEKRALLSATDGIVDGTDNYDRITIADNTDTSVPEVDVVRSMLVKVESFSDANFTVQVGPTITFSTTVRTIVVNGGDKDDLIQISANELTSDANFVIDGGAGTDRLHIIGPGISGDATYSPDSGEFGTGVFEIAGGADLEFENAETVVAFSFGTLNIITPQGSDDVVANKASNGYAQISGESDTVDLTPIQFFDVQNLILDLSANDTEDSSQDQFETTGEGLSGSGLNSFTVKTGLGNDEFFIHPSTGTEINIDAGSPSGDVGDRLVVEFAGVLNYRLPRNVSEGAITSTSHATINFMDVEAVESTAVTLLSPSGIVDNVRPTFTWTTNENASAYEVWVGNLDLGQRVVNAMPYSQRTVRIADLSEDAVTTHHVDVGIEGWQSDVDLQLGRHRIWVRPIINGQPSAWSQPRDFTISVAPIAFLNATREIDPTPTFVWDVAPGARKYEVWVSNRTAGTSKTYTVTAADAHLAISNFPRFTVPGEDALPLGNFRYSVRAFDATLNPTAWSAIRNFSIVTPPQIIRPVLPSIEGRTTFEWAAVNGANRYELYVNSVNEDGTETNVLRKTDIVGESYQVVEALPDGDYRYWVRAFNDTNGATAQSRWSNDATFSVGADIKPVITGPAGTVAALRPTITWGAIDGVARYEVWISDTVNSEPLILAERIYTNSYTTEVTLPAGTYFAWVRAISVRGVITDWSEPFVFESNGGVSEITSPIGTTGDVLPRITWTTVSDAATYELFIRQVAGAGSGSAVDFQIPDITTNGYTPTAPLNNGTYRLWVRAINANGEKGAWSAGSNFTIVDNASDVDSSTDGLLDDGSLMASLVEFPSEEQPVEASPSIPAEPTDQPDQNQEPILVAEQKQPAVAPPVDPIVNPVDIAIDQIVSEWPQTNWWS